jgi:hypothetical protein
MTGRAYYLTTLREWNRHAGRFANSHWVAADPVTPLTEASDILVLVEGDESVHLALEQDSAFEPLPHPLSNRPVSEHVAAKLAAHRVAPGATTFDLAEAVARTHPLLRHRVF